MGTFLGGLNPALANHVQMFAPTTLKDVIRLARRSDELQRQQKGHHQRAYTLAPRPALTSSVPPEKNFTTNTSIQTPKKLSWEEMKRKRSLGLCFSCDERYSPGHKCKTSQLLLMIGEDVEDDEEEEEFHEPGEPEITLQALTGWGSSKKI